MASHILNHIVLPRHISTFERQYLTRVNRIGLWFFALHVPVLMVIAYFNDTGALLAGALSLAVVAGPALAFFTFDNPRTVSLTYGFTAMLMGGVLVHVGQGPVQIEMHFYFFALLAMLALYGNPAVILVAAVTVALHHLVLWLVLPTSVFNYDAPIWVVAVHAAFVVLESVATCFIARTFFDNVIGLEKIVQARTAELDGRNRDMRLVLDHVDQGLLTIDRTGDVSPEYSALVETWFGEVAPGTKFASLLARAAPVEGEMFELGLQDVLDGYLPLEVTLAQLPKRFAHGTQTFSIEYTPISSGDELEKLLIIITDISAILERERLEAEQQEMVQVFDRLARDRSGFLEFVDEARLLISLIGRGIEAEHKNELVRVQRALHTLKGNSTIFGIKSIADLCHDMETTMEEEERGPSKRDCDELALRFARLQGHVETVLGGAVGNRIEIEPAEHEAVLRSLLRDEPRLSIVKRMASWALEPTEKRLERIAEQAKRIAERLNKGPLQVVIRDSGLRLEAAKWASFWSSFVHVVRNAVDHGLESRAERVAAGKSELGTLELITRLDKGQFIVEINDNGRGLMWSAIAERAQELGLPHATRSDLLAAVFTDGFSTASVVSDYSGRGIGMGAMREECERRGGKMEVQSNDGAGTRITFTFPERAMAEERQATAA